MGYMETRLQAVEAHTQTAREAHGFCGERCMGGLEEICGDCEGSVGKGVWGAGETA